MWKRFWRLSRSGTFEAFFDALAAMKTAHFLAMNYNNSLSLWNFTASGGRPWALLRAGKAIEKLKGKNEDQRHGIEIDRVGFGQAVEPGEQANALTAGKLGLGRAPAEERHPRTKSSGADCLRPPIPCLRAVWIITASLTGKTLPLARSRAILYAGHSVILITFVAKTAMFDNGVTQCPCP